MKGKPPQGLPVAGKPHVAGRSGTTGIERDAERYRQDRKADDGQLRDALVSLLPRLRRFAYALTRDGDAANDLVQETCARALTKSDLWQEGTRLDSWLFRVAQNIWFDRKRAEKTRGDRIDVDAIADLAGVDGRDVTESRLTLDEVARGIARLKPDHQVVVGLVCVDGMSYKEAADVLQLPIGTVMSRLSRARLELSEYLERSARSVQRTRSEGPK
ncbi:MAG: RNA polymerase sigma factor [Proteobacteria bacterium]|nr:RNA polymerase sigma factor [Pseudomonadota bacterium]